MTKVENMGRVNYGPFMYDRKGILSSVKLGGSVLRGWRMLPLPFHNLNEQKRNSIVQISTYSGLKKTSSRKILKNNSDNSTNEPALFVGSFTIGKFDQVKDTFISFNGWSKGVAFVNDFNIGRFWPSYGPQCNLYVPAPILRHGENVVVILELESPSHDLEVISVDQPDFTCGLGRSSVHQL